MTDRLGADSRTGETLDACQDLHSISYDFHAILRDHCERCQSGFGVCVVEKLKARAFEEQQQRPRQSDCA
jgi:hypothetical protein